MGSEKPVKLWELAILRVAPLVTCSLILMLMTVNVLRCCRPVRTML